MDGERWAELKESFAALSRLSPDEQARRVAVLASSNPALSERLEWLLAADARVDSLLEPYELLSSTCAGDAAQVVGADAGAEQPDPFGLAGRTVSHFKVREVLGCGGMGVVYRAEDLRLGRTVALKFLLPQYSFDDSAKERFLQEARAASALDHPNVCTVHEVGESDEGQLFLAMSCYGGETLKARLARTARLAAADAVVITRQVLQGLGAAHAAGIVHRDLKPGNLMLTPEGTVKILDFGLAKVVHDLNLTDPEQRPGTVAYMSPQQLRGEALDHRTDLWSLGAVLYEMLTGRTPFGGGHDLATVYSILHDEPTPPSASREGIPEALDRLVGKLLCKDSEARYATAAEVLAELEMTGPASSVWAPSRRQYRPSTLARPAALALAALLLAGGVAFALIGLPGPKVADPADGRGTASTPAGFSSPGIEQASLAVLPFVDMSSERDQEYFADGITEEILNALARVPELRVPARTSSFFFKGKNLPVREIARQLDVATVLEGSIRRMGDSVRITAQLIDARSDRHLWSRTFDRRLEDVFAVQTEIARTVAEALQVRLSVGPSLGGARPPASPIAHDLYLRGLFHWNRRSANDLGHAIRSFEESIRADSGYARAHAGLALAYAVAAISFTSSVPAAEAFPRAEAAASQALALDASLGEAHAARAYAYHWQWRWEDAEREFQRAIALSPTNATARQWYGEHLAKMGQGRQGEEQLRRAIELDPLSLVAHNDLGIVLMLNRRYPEAIAQLEHTHRMDPGFAIPSYLLHKLYLLMGRTEDAARAGRRWAELSAAADPDEIMTLVRVTRSDSERPAALAILARWEQAPAPRWVDIAYYYTLLEERERAVAALEHGLRLRLPMMAQLIRGPWFDPLRADPRVARLLREMRLPPLLDSAAADTAG